MCILGFAGFLRINELLGIQIKHISMFGDHVEILLPNSKTDQLREGHIVMISRTGSSACPVFWLQKYLSLSVLQNNPENFLFCRMSKTKVGHKADGRKPISYTTAREDFTQRMGRITKDGKKYGLHSLRSGGASAAANCGVSDRKIRKHGRWVSTASRDRYIKDSMERRLDVSKSLNLLKKKKTF